MCDRFIGKYGFVQVTDDIIKQCKCNDIIIPRAFRFLSMGYGQILADVKGHPGMVFDLLVGGSNGLEAEYNQNKLSTITIKDAIKIQNLNLDKRL